MPNPTKEQRQVLDNKKKRLIVSASAGSGKTFVLIELITKLVCENHVPVKRLLVLTFTRAAAGEMRERLNKSILSKKQTPFLLEQLDDLPVADISTIDAFCEKVIKRNLSQTSLDESFKIIDEEIAKKYKERAFQKTIEAFEKSDDFAEIYFAFKKNRDMIFDCMEKIDSFVGALENKKEFCLRAENGQEEFYQKSLKILNEDLKNKWNDLKSLALSAWQSAEEKFQAEAEGYKGLCQLVLSEDFVKNVKDLKSLVLPVSVRSGKDEGVEIKKLRKEFKDFLAGLEKYNFDNQTLVQKAREGSLAKALIRMYNIYSSFYAKEKEEIDALDFSDIEEICLNLLKKEDVLKSLQESYDYIFIDEYQDTNRLQEAIVKPIAEKGYFVAVGDPKQGIYGFRNASMEIMNKDIKDFQQAEDGDALFLRGNFRSDKNILDFVNKIFEVVMTEKDMGVDYKGSSMLEGLTTFDRQHFPAVRVDIIQEEEKEVEKAEKMLYSVKGARLEFSNKNKLEAECICARIDEILQKDVYDPKRKMLKKCEYSDIALLFRGRSPLMDEVANELGKRGVPVVSDKKVAFLEEGEVAMLLSLFKLAIGIKDEVALASVMMSVFGNFSPDEMAKFALSGRSLFETMQDENEKILHFKEMIETFRKNCQILGVYKSLDKLFVEHNYFAYLSHQTDGEEKLRLIISFTSQILSSGFDYDLPSLVSYFENGSAQSKGGQSPNSNAILMTTIHATKGLEYPVVFLCDAGAKLEKPYRNNFILNKDLTIATYAYDTKERIKMTTPNFEACKILAKKKEFVDEIMIFYVALTRAKNHLYIVGSEKEENLVFDENQNIFDLKNYLQIIAFVFGKNFIKKLYQTESQKINDWEFNIVTKVEKTEIEENILEKAEVDGKFAEKIENYLNFSYPYQNICKLDYKSSVTAILNLEKEEERDHLSAQSREQSINEGNLYHLALKKIEFENVEDIASLEKEIKHLGLTEEEEKIIDKNILLKDILLLKEKCGNLVTFKERQFTMQADLSEISGINANDKVLIQGIVDLFAMGEKNILIDYKWTNESRGEKLLLRYGKQLELYKMAIEKCFSKKIDEIYIFSLKNGQFIKYL